LEFTEIDEEPEFNDLDKNQEFTPTINENEININPKKISLLNRFFKHKKNVIIQLSYHHAFH